jgi:hypothetical protein
MKHLAIVSTLVFYFFAAACGKKDDGGSSSAKATEKAAATKLPALGLQLDVPGETVTVDKAMMGEGNSIAGDAVGAMQVETFKDPQTLDQAKDDAKMFTPKNLKGDALADGWALTFDNKGSMGANFFVTVRRDLAGKTYKCWATVDSKERGEAVLAACKTLRK